MSKRKSQTAADSESPHERSILWVMRTLSSEVRRLEATEEEAPSLEAWALFSEYQANEKTRREFMEKFYKPLYAKEKPAELSVAIKDDQRKHMNWFALLELERPELLHGRPDPIVAELAEVSRDCRPESIVAGTCVIPAAVSSTDAAAAQA